MKWAGMERNGWKWNGMELVGDLIALQGSRSLLKIGSWTLSNLCDGQPRPVLDVHTVVPALAKLLQHGDSEILRYKYILRSIFLFYFLLPFFVVAQVKYKYMYIHLYIYFFSAYANFFFSFFAVIPK